MLDIRISFSIGAADNCDVDAHRLIRSGPPKLGFRKPSAQQSVKQRVDYREASNSRFEPVISKSFDNNLTGS